MDFYRSKVFLIIVSGGKVEIGIFSRGEEKFRLAEKKGTDEDLSVWFEQSQPKLRKMNN